MSKKRAARNTKAFRKSVTKASNNTSSQVEPVRENAWSGIKPGVAKLVTGNKGFKRSW